MDLRSFSLSLSGRAARLGEYALENAGTLYAYAGVFYFMEIIYFMVAMAFLYGRVPAVVTGLTLSALLCLQLIGLAMRKEPFRKAQLFLMEIHAAYSIPFIIGALSGGLSAGGYDLIFTSLRMLLVAVEIPGLYILTDDRAKVCFA